MSSHEKEPLPTSSSPASHTMSNHELAIKAISGQVRDFYDKEVPFRIYHGSTNCTRPNHQSPHVDISILSNVLGIDPIACTALVEPNVPMDQLVTATLKHGLIPPVVMEFPGITVGGGFAGSAGESSSFKHGYFSETANWVEMVLGTGECVKVSPSEKADLFKGAAGALGTLSITTLVELRLIAAKKFVRLTYHRENSVGETVDLIRNECDNPNNDYIDGVMYSRDTGLS